MAGGAPPPPPPRHVTPAAGQGHPTPPALPPPGGARRRAGPVRPVARHARRLEESAGMTLGDARRRLCALPGVGPWTAAEVALSALGDADAVSVGDYHLPHHVAWALAGEARGDDERMLELLEPYRGHRGRVLRLVVAGAPGPPRFGPRLPF